VVPGRIANLFAARHARDLLDALGALDAQQARRRPPVDLALLDPEMGARVSGDLRQMGDAEDLMPARELGEAPSHAIGGPAADTRVDLVEDQHHSRVGLADRGFDREKRARELAARRRTTQWEQLSGRARREAELSGFEASGAARRALGRRGGHECDFEARLGHGHLAQRGLDRGAEPLARLAPLLRKPPGLGAELLELADAQPVDRLRAIARAFELCELFGRRVAIAQGCFDRASVFALQRFDLGEPLVERAETSRIGLDPRRIAFELRRGIAQLLLRGAKPREQRRERGVERLDRL